MESKNLFLRKSDITQTVIAKRFSVSSAFISYLLSGKRKSKDLQKRIAKAYGIRYAELWGNGATAK